MSEMVDIYALRDPRDGRVRYIGKANSAADRLRSHLRDSRRRDTPVYRWIRKLLAAGHAPLVEVIWRVPADGWQEHERNAIAFAVERGHKLLNVAPGGDEPFCPPEVRRANGLASAARMRRCHADPKWRRVWELNRHIGQRVASGTLSEAGRAKIRLAAQKAPHLFGRWANL